MTVELLTLQTHLYVCSLRYGSTSYSFELSSFSMPVVARASCLALLGLLYVG